MHGLVIVAGGKEMTVGAEVGIERLENKEETLGVAGEDKALYFSLATAFIET